MKRSTPEVEALVTKAEALIKQGTPTMEACTKVGITGSTLYCTRARLKKLARKPARKLLNITELPAFVPKVGGLFMVYGSPELLASFMKVAQ